MPFSSPYLTLLLMRFSVPFLRGRRRCSTSPLAFIARIHIIMSPSPSLPHAAHVVISLILVDDMTTTLLILVIPLMDSSFSIRGIPTVAISFISREIDVYGLV